RRRVAFIAICRLGSAHGYFFLNSASSFALLLAIRALVSSGAPFRNVKKLQKLAFSRSGMYSAMCSLHWLWAAGSQCSQFLQQCKSKPQCVHVSARWSFTSKTSSFLHLWQKCRFSSTLGTQPITLLRSALAVWGAGRGCAT